MERAVVQAAHAAPKVRHGLRNRAQLAHRIVSRPRLHQRRDIERRTAVQTRADGADGGPLQSTDRLAAAARVSSDEWSRATVVENKEASADGNVRILVLSVEDHVAFIEGRKVKHVQEHARWIDRYSQPGQHVALRYAYGCGSIDDAPDDADLLLARRLLALASSPYDARRDSAMLDGAIVEVCVNRQGDDDERQLAELGPGALIEVSNVLGKGFCSLFNSHVNLLSALEESRPLVMVGVGCRGMAPLRAALSWAPVLAHATTQRIALVHVAEGPTAAPFLVEWDSWREAGVIVKTVYENDGNWPSRRSIDLLLEEALFLSEGGLGALTANDPRNAAVLLSGVPSNAAAHLSRRLTQAGVSSERILVCDYGL